jgi:hypothetical protein
MQRQDDTWKFDETEAPGEEEAAELVSDEILNYPADTTLKGYLEQWDAAQLRVLDFLRRYVWDIKKASKLIESSCSACLYLAFSFSRKETPPISLSLTERNP